VASAGVVRAGKGGCADGWAGGPGERDACRAGGAGAVRAGDGFARVERTDRSGPEGPELYAAGRDAEGGRGLQMVAGLAARWAGGGVAADSDLVRAAVRLTLLSGDGPGVDLPLTRSVPGTGLRQSRPGVEARSRLDGWNLDSRPRISVLRR
jgi:hypothetical protein